jgi:hypothetical protein
VSCTYLLLYSLLTIILSLVDPKAPQISDTELMYLIMSSPKTKKQDLKRKLNEFRPRMRSLIENADDVSFVIPTWQPSADFDQDMATHLSKLKIPGVPMNRPNLLLHNLGEERTKNDRDRLARIPTIFRPEDNTYVP